MFWLVEVVVTRPRGRSIETALEELSRSRRVLEDALARPVTTVSYPFGTHDPNVTRLAREAGYRVGLTLKRWRNAGRTNPLRLGRMSVGGTLPPWQLALKLLKMSLTPSRP